jgi:hypothetical protein
LALSDSGHLEALKTARDAIVDGIAAGRLTVSYMIRGRQHQTKRRPTRSSGWKTRSSSTSAKLGRSTNKTFRLASLQRPRLRDSST